MIVISNKEELKLFKAAQEQLEIRLHNSKGTNTDSLIDEVFSKLDLEGICPEFVAARKKDIQELNAIHSDAILKKDVARIAEVNEKIRTDKCLEGWKMGNELGKNIEIEILRKKFIAIKKGRAE